jgi:hypothetical protein
MRLYSHLLGAILALASTSASPLQRRQEGGLQWGACDTVGNTTTTLSCATLNVPRDYTVSDGETITLQLVRSKATKEPFKGSIMFNPGGPGYSGRNDLNSVQEALHE